MIMLIMHLLRGVLSKIGKNRYRGKHVGVIGNLAYRNGEDVSRRRQLLQRLGRFDKLIRQCCYNLDFASRYHFVKCLETWADQHLFTYIKEPEKRKTDFLW